MQCRRFSLFLACCSLGACIMGSVFLHVISDVEMERKAAQAMLEEVWSKKLAAQEYQSTHENYEKYEKEVLSRHQLMQDKIPEKLMTGKFISELQRIAGQGEAQLLSIIPGKVEQLGHGSSQSVELTVKGDFFTILSFVRGLEDCKLFIHVDSLSLKGDGHLVECHMGLRIYSDN